MVNVTDQDFQQPNPDLALEESIEQAQLKVESSPEALESEQEQESEQTQASDQENNEPWQRISPIAIVYFIFQFFKQMFGNVVYLAPALIIGYNKILEQPQIWLPVMYGFIALVSLFALLSYYFFQFRLTQEQIEIRSGVFSKKYINLPFARIQNVEITEPLYYRPLGYACMQLDTAGSIQQEAKVVAIYKPLAIELKQKILASHKLPAGENNNVNEQDDAHQHTNAAPEVVLDRRNLDDLVIHGITNNRIWIFVGGLLPFIDDISSEISVWLLRFGFNVEHFFQFSGQSGWQIATTAITLTIMIMIPLTIFSVLGSIIAFHDFTLSKSDDRYIRRSGLFTKNEITMRLSRLQMIIRQQDWLDVVLGRINLKFEQNNANINAAQPGQLSNKIIVPSVTTTECQTLIDDAYPDNQLADIVFNRVSPRLLIRNIALFWLPITFGLASLFIYNNDFDALMPLGFISGFVLVLFIAKYLRWGFAHDDNFIYIRKGCLGVDYHCFPIYKVQQCSFSQNWWLKRKGICSIQFILASGYISIPYISEVTGNNLLNMSLYQVESSKRSWM